MAMNESESFLGNDVVEDDEIFIVRMPFLDTQHHLYIRAGLALVARR